jgi:hypothetical protein
MASKSDFVPRELNLTEMSIQIIGTSPLLCHSLSKRDEGAITDAAQKKSNLKGKEAVNPVMKYIDSLYWISGKPNEEDNNYDLETIIENGRFGMPLISFKLSAVAGAFRAGLTKDMVSMFGAYYVEKGIWIYDPRPVEVGEIFGSKPLMRKDPGRNPNARGSALCMIYRGEFHEWNVKLNIRYNKGVVSEDQIRDYFTAGGFAVGVGEWRPEKGGQHGMYKVG